MPGGVWRTADAAAVATLPRGFLAAEPLGRVAVLTSSLHRKVVDFETAMGDMQTEHNYSLFKAYVNREQRTENRAQRTENRAQNRE